MKCFFHLVLAIALSLSLSLASPQSASARNKNLNKIIGIGAGIIILNEMRKGFKKKRRRSHKRVRNSRKSKGKNSANKTRSIAVQRSLNSLGYNVGKVDGKVGSGTRAQIAAWQYSIGTGATGILTARQFLQLTSQAGVSTGNLPSAAVAYQAEVNSQTLSRDDIRILQRSLNILGYKSGLVDGKIGRGTSRALKRFLEDRGQDPETTSPQTAVALAAEVAGIPYSDSRSAETGGGRFAVAKPRSGEVSIFDNAQQSLNSEDFERDVAAKSGRAGGGLESFTIYDMDRKDLTRDAKGLRDLVAMMIAANPGLLDDNERLANLYKFEGGTYKSSYRIEETLAAYRNELKSRPAPDVAKVALQWTGNFGVGSYRRTDGLFPVQYDQLGMADEKPARDFVMRINLLGYENPLHVSLPNLPNVGGIKMTLPQAEDFEKKLVRTKYNFMNTRAYVVFDNVSYDANRNRMSADTKLVAVNLTEKYDAKKLIHTWPVEGAELGGLITEQLSDASDFVDFMGGMRVIQDHVVADRTSDWSRLAAALLLGAKPDVMQEDDTAISMAKALLLPNEERLLWQGHPPRDNWRVNEFDWRDTANKVRDAFGDALQKRAVKVPFRFVNIRPVNLGRYDFGSSNYKMKFDQDKVIEFGYSRDTPASIVAGLGNTFLPGALEIPEGFARQLDGIMRVKGNRRFYLAIFSDVKQISSVRRSQSRGNSLYRLNINPKITRIALYADRAMTKLVFDFYGKEGSKLRRLQAEKKSVFEAFSIPHASYDSLLLTADRLVNDPKMLKRVIRTSDQADGANELEVDDAIALIVSKLNAISVPDELWLSGRLALGKYNNNKGGFSIASLGFSKNSSKTARFSGEFKHELINDLGYVEMPRNAARRLLKRFPKREFSFRLRVKPASASWSPLYDDYTTINMAHEAQELYILIGDRRTDDRKKSILARLTFGIDEKEEQVSKASRSIDLGERLTLTRDLINAVVVSQHDGTLKNRSVNWLVAQQWLADKSNIVSLKQGFFKKGARAPTKATANLLKHRFLKWRGANPIKMPEKLRISFHNGSHPLYLESGASINDNLRAKQCHLAKLGYWSDLAKRLDLGDLNQFSNKQNDQIYRGTPDKPTVMSPVLMVFSDSPFKCTSRKGENLAKNFVQIKDSWAPRVQIVFDRLPMPPIQPSSAAYIVDADVSVIGMEFVENGGDLPHLVLRVAFEKATYNDFNAGKKSPLRSITREETEPKAATAVDGGAVDIIGVEVGMNLDEADAVLRKHFGEPTILEPVFEPSLQTPTFHFARMYVSKNRNERVSIFYEKDGDEPRVLAIERKLDSPDWKISRKAVYQSALKKYGKSSLQSHGDYSTELIWGKSVGRQIDETSYSGGTCKLSTSAVRIDQWKQSNGAVHNIWEFFTSDNSYNAQMGYTPQIDFYVQPEFSRYVEQCGHFLRLEHNHFGLTIMLMDLKKYASSYLKAREIFKNSLNDVSKNQDQEVSDVKL